MFLTVKDAMQLLRERKVHVIAGKQGLDNQISCAHIMFNKESLKSDSRGWLVLIPLNLFGNDPVFVEELIQRFSACGSAGIAFKLEPGDTLSEEVTALAERLNFPILNIPFEETLSDIMNEINMGIFNSQSLLLVKSNQIHNSLTNLVLEGKEIGEIIDYASELIGCSIVYFDTSLTPKHYRLMNVPHDRSHSIVKQIQDGLSAQPYFSIYSHKSMEVSIDGIHYTLVSQALTAGSQFYGNICMVETKSFWSEINKNALEHVCTVITLELIKQRAVQMAQQCHARDLVESLISSDGDISDHYDELQKIELLPVKNIQCVVIDCCSCGEGYNLNAVRGNLCIRIRKLIRQEFPLALIAENKGSIVLVLVGRDGNAFADTILQIQALLQAEFEILRFCAGVGTLVHTVVAVKESYATAKTCIHLGKKMKGMDTITFPREIASYDFINSCTNVSLLYDACESMVSALHLTDQAGNTEYLLSLKTFIELDQNIAETASQLYIHRNTLANRLDKISDIIGPVWNDAETAFNLKLFFRYQRLQ